MADGVLLYNVKEREWNNRFGRKNEIVWPKPNNRLYGFPNTGYKNWIIGFGVSVKNLEFGISFRDSFRVWCCGRVFEFGVAYCTLLSLFFSCMCFVFVSVWTQV